MYSDSHKGIEREVVMFIRILTWDAVFKDDIYEEGRKFLESKLLASQMDYECDAIQIVERLVERDDGTKEAIMEHILYEKGSEIYVIEVPKNPINQIFEVFKMNNEGNTIDRYCY